MQSFRAVRALSRGSKPWSQCHSVRVKHFTSLIPSQQDKISSDHLVDEQHTTAAKTELLDLLDMGGPTSIETRIPTTKDTVELPDHIQPNLMALETQLNKNSGPSSDPIWPTSIASETQVMRNSSSEDVQSSPVTNIRATGETGTTLEDSQKHFVPVPIKPFAISTDRTFESWPPLVRRSPSSTQPQTEQKKAHRTTLRGRKRSTVDATSVMIQSTPFNEFLLRDACTCAKSQELFTNGDVAIKWENDIPGFGSDHVSFFPKSSLNFKEPFDCISQDYSLEALQLPFVPWTASGIRRQLQFVTYDDYMTSDKTLHRALSALNSHGMLLVRGVPESEKSVEDLAGRFGNIRDTLYGRTWDVKSVPSAKNVAYTSQYLGLHMDLLYMANPPGFQFLHCLKNTAEGGSSLFADAVHVLLRYLTPEQRTIMARVPIAYQYRNAGEHYYHLHPLIELKGGKIAYINYSPPFQARWAFPTTHDPLQIHEALTLMKRFADRLQHPRSLFEYRLQEGECVIFNNRRILHGRKQFDALGGERWLKGTYVDTDVVASRTRVMEERFRNQEMVPAKFVLDSEPGVE
ncbi:hypothetical protein G7Y89_g564 [Cudoniella acicularis]|uniref:TauD/TfdA-like domain-containing protein n=1 Tax=Cudoniella acicularis TaxID=354080 RepID=A0A8H4RYM9_9HELO|nr:hypothetical protein G7Y89_g564 [Cudoniella acicularis]